MKHSHGKQTQMESERDCLLLAYTVVMENTFVLSNIPSVPLDQLYSTKIYLLLHSY